VAWRFATDDGRSCQIERKDHYSSSEDTKNVLVATPNGAGEYECVTHGTEPRFSPNEVVQCSHCQDIRQDIRQYLAAHFSLDPFRTPVQPPRSLQTPLRPDSGRCRFDHHARQARERRHLHPFAQDSRRHRQQRSARKRHPRPRATKVSDTS